MAGTALLGFWSSGGEYGGTMLQILVCAYSHGSGRRQSPAFVAARAVKASSYSNLLYEDQNSPSQRHRMPKSDGLLSPGEVLWTFRANGPIACRPAVNEVPATGIAHVYAPLTSFSPLYIPNIPNDTYMLTCFALLHLRHSSCSSKPLRYFGSDDGVLYAIGTRARKASVWCVAA